MPWLAKQTCKLPQEDLISFTFDHLSYDPDKPVRHSITHTDSPTDGRTDLP